jgi:hypothetical protein
VNPQPKRSNTRTLIIVAGVLFLVGLLLGFVPQFRSASALREELKTRDQRVQQLERDVKLSRARNLAGLLYLELTRRNYGNAAQHAAGLFDQVRGMLNDSSPDVRAGLDKILTQREAMMAAIAKSDGAAVDLAQQILDQLHRLPSP